jgi:hypothetical protein
MKTPLDKFKKTLWERHFGENTNSKCLCCKITTIKSTSFHAGHIVPENYGGEAIMLNLLPICGTCNTKMGSKNYLIDWAKKQYNNILELDEEYSEYQKNAFIKFENYKILKEKLIDCKPQQKVDNLSAIIMWFITNKYLHPEKSVEDYIEFIKLKPQGTGNSIDETSRVDEFYNIIIDGCLYDKIRLRSHIIGSVKPIVELSYTFEKSKTDLFPKIINSGWGYLEYQGPSSRSNCYKFKDYSLWVQPYGCYVEK